MLAVWSAAQVKGGRDYQEDSLAVLENGTAYYQGAAHALPDNALPSNLSIYLLADGMGGMGHGDLASATIIEGFIQALLQGRMSDDIRPTGDHDYWTGVLQQAMLAANADIESLVESKPELKGMGSTLVVALWNSHENTLEWLSVGDSLLYLYRDESLQPLNEKHTWRAMANKGYEAYQMPAQELAMYGDSLCSALDGQEIRVIDTSDRPLTVLPNDIVLLASDGFESLSQDEIADLCEAQVICRQAVNANDELSQHKAVPLRLQEEMFKSLESKAKSSQDNSTLIVVSFFGFEQ